MSLREDIKKYIEDEFNNNVIPALSDFIKIANPSRDFDPEWKTDKIQLKAANFVVDWAKKQNLKGVQFNIFEEQDRTPVVMVVVDKNKTKSEQSVLVYGHLDKQPPMTEGWDEGLGPYTPVIKDGKLYGRGGVDDGYAFFSTIMMVKALQKFDLPYKRMLLYYETDEESGSKDLIYFLDKHKDLVGDPKILICLDSGTINYERFSISTALRGVLNFNLKCETTVRSLDSNLYSNIVKDNFNAMRQAIYGFQDKKTGEVPKDFSVKIPKEQEEYLETLVKEIPNIDFGAKLLEGVEMMSNDPLELLKYNIWRPTFTILGQGELPVLKKSGDLLRRTTSLKCSMRLPPTLKPEDAKKAVLSYFENIKGINNSKFTVSDFIQGEGFASPKFDQELLKIAKDSAQEIFNKEMIYLGVGGSIPFMGKFLQLYPKSQFFITGMVTPSSNIHVPNENLLIEYGPKLFQTLTLIVSKSADL